MGVEDEVEQSSGRPCRQRNGRSKRPNELTSSIVPRGTSFHRSVELECSPIVVVSELLSCCCCFFPGPAELSAVNPYTVHDHRQPACQTPGGIIPLRWAASSRNGGRHHSVTAGDIISLRWAAWAGISMLNPTKEFSAVGMTEWKRTSIQSCWRSRFIRP